MYSDISVEQRVHDLAVRATVLYYQQNGLSLCANDTGAFEFGVTYRNFLKGIRKSIEEGATDLL